MSSPARLRVAIIGGGIGGLALALALSRTKERELIEVDIFEATPELSEIGAGIAVSPRVWETLKSLGLGDSLSGLLNYSPDRVPGIVFQFRKSDQPEGITIRNLVMNGGIMTFHRADLQRVLLEHLGSACKLHLSRRLASYHESNTGIELNFENGSTAACDLLVGADGLKSPVRKTLIAKLPKAFGDHTASLDPIWSGSAAYRGLVNSSQLAQRMPSHRALTTPMMYCGKGKHLVVYPISQGRLINVVAFATQPGKEGTLLEGPAVLDVSKEEVMSMFSGWEEEVRILLGCIEKPSRWAIQALTPLKTYAHARVALIGDAAHAMTPHQGAGAGQAIEDAYILSTVISNAVRTQAPIARITEVYNSIRQPFANGIQNNSRNQGKLYEFTAPGFEDVQEGDNTVPFDRLLELVERVEKLWEWAWKTSIEGDRKRALAML